jgi:hypothetical protein
MRLTIEAWRCAARALCISALALTATPTAHSTPAQKESEGRAPAAEPETASQAQARTILMNMAQFLGGTPSFRVSIRGGYDAVQPSGQKTARG